MLIDMPEIIKYDNPFIINIEDNSSNPVEDVKTYVDDIFKGKTDEHGNITITIRGDIKFHYHQGDKNELIIMLGYTNKEKRQLISDQMIHMLSYPFRMAEFEPGYYMLFLTPEEYSEVSTTYVGEDSFIHPITSMGLLKEKYEIPVSVPEFLTMFDHVDMHGSSQVAFRFQLSKAIDEVYNRPNAHNHHFRNLGLAWHELGHDIGDMYHDEDYSTLPDHGGGKDNMGNYAYPCIMCSNNWVFCPKCRKKLRAINPNVHCWQTWQEREDMKNNHLYWYQKDLLNTTGEWAVGQLHQPQINAESVKRP
jgi:hypothetical protein